MTATYNACCHIELDSWPELDRGIVLVKYGKDEIITCDIYHVSKLYRLWRDVIRLMLDNPWADLAFDVGGMGVSWRKRGKYRLTLHIDSFQEEYVEMDEEGLRDLLAVMAEAWQWASGDEKQGASQ
jgi:hypothetical protein